MLTSIEATTTSTPNSRDVVVKALLHQPGRLDLRVEIRHALVGIADVGTDQGEGRLDGLVPVDRSMGGIRMPSE